MSPMGPTTIVQRRHDLGRAGPRTMGPSRVDELSGGEQRRVALAGLLVRDPSFSCSTSPTQGWTTRRGRARADTRPATHERDMATVVVSHDLDNAELLGDRSWSSRPGGVAASAASGAARDADRAWAATGFSVTHGRASSAGPQPAPRRDPRRSLRPGTSPIHRMWAGTKLVALGVLSIGLLLWPTWRRSASWPH